MKKYIINIVAFGFMGTKESFVGYFPTMEDATSYINKRFSSYEKVSDDEYQLSDSIGCTTLLIFDSDDKEFLANIEVRKQLGKAYFNEEKMVQL